MRSMCVVSKEPCVRSLCIPCRNYTKCCRAMYEAILTGTMCVTFMYTILLVFGILSEVADAGCDSYGLSVTDVTASSAVLHWNMDFPSTSGDKSRMKSDHEVHCAGVRHYTKVDGSYATDTDKMVRFVPRRLDHVYLGNLLPNFKYSCIVKKEGDKLVDSDVDMSRPLLFSTHYKAPETPKAPVIHYTDSSQDFELKVDLFTSSSKFGPLSGYKVQFHIVDEKTPYTDGLPRILTEFLKPSGPLASLEKARENPKPVSFYIAYEIIPENITIGDGLLDGALKNGVKYTIVTVVYTKLNDNSENLLYSASKPSQPFTAEGHKSLPKKDKLTVPRASRNLAITLGVGLPLIIMVYVSALGAVIAQKELRTLKQGNLSTRVLSPSVSPTSGYYRPQDSIHHASDIEDSFESFTSLHHYSEHTMTEQVKGSPVLPYDPTSDSCVYSHSWVYLASSAVDIDELYKQGEQEDQGSHSFPPLTTASKQTSGVSMQSEVSQDLQTHSREEEGMVKTEENSDLGQAVQVPIEHCSSVEHGRLNSESEGWTGHQNSESDKAISTGVRREERSKISLIPSDESLPSQTSSHVFLPRGYSSGQMFSRSTIHNVHAQLSVASSFGYQSDQAPELELDAYTEMADENTVPSALDGTQECLSESRPARHSCYTCSSSVEEKEFESKHEEEENVAKTEEVDEEEDFRQAENLTTCFQKPIDGHSSIEQRRPSLENTAGTGSQSSESDEEGETLFTDIDLSRENERSSVNKVTAGESLPSQISSHIFLPRGFSSGPCQMSRRSTVRNIHAQLNTGSSPGHQSDPASEVELDTEMADKNPLPSAHEWPLESEPTGDSCHACSSSAEDKNDQEFETMQAHGEEKDEEVKTEELEEESDLGQVEKLILCPQQPMLSSESESWIGSQSDKEWKAISADISLSKEDDKRRISFTPSDESLPSQTSGHVFLPRGYSSDQMFSHSTIRNMRAQLSVESSLGHQSDQAPELELDWFEPDLASQ